MIQRAQITKVDRYTQGKDGNAYKTKQGKPFTRLGCKFDKTGTEVIYGTDFDGGTKDWKVGDYVFIDLFDEEYNGKMYKKFRVAGKVELLEAKIEEMEKRLKKLEGKTTQLPTGDELPEDLQGAYGEEYTPKI